MWQVLFFYVIDKKAIDSFSLRLQAVYPLMYLCAYLTRSVQTNQAKQAQLWLTGHSPREFIL